MNRLKLIYGFCKAKQNVKLSAGALQKKQEKLLRRILRYAYCYSDYYRQSFTDAGITEQNINTLPLSAFPTINKTVLLENFEALVTEEDITQEALLAFDDGHKGKNGLYQGKYHIVHSSGSTGKPGYFLYDKNAWDSMLIGIIRAALWDLSVFDIIKLLKGKPRILYVAATDGLYGGTMAVGDGVSGLGASQLHLDVNTPLSDWVESVRNFKPNIVIGYPSAIKILGELAVKGKITVEINRIITCGEPLGTNARHYFESVFGAKVLNFYGASESLALGVEENAKDGMILFDDMNIIEVEDGNMYLTSLYNFAQPLIRYQLTDHIMLCSADKSSECSFSRVSGLIGRNEDVLWFTHNGVRDFLHPLSVEGICIDGLVDYQFRKTADAAFEMFAEISENADRERIENQIRRQMDSIMQKKKLNDIQYTITFVKQILPDSATGKKRLILPDTEKERTPDEKYTA